MNNVTAEEKEEFLYRLKQAERLEKARAKKVKGIAPPDVIWAPQQGSQRIFLGLTDVYEMLYHGGRGGGKSDTLLMSFLQHCEKGFGDAWRGVIFRQTYPQLSDMVSKVLRWCPKIFGDRVSWNQQSMTLKWQSGEKLMLRHMSKPDDYFNYHGHEYGFVGWEELTTWPDDVCYKRMMSTLRSGTKGLPLMVRSTTNPYGVGHGWVKERFMLPVKSNKPLKIETGGNSYIRMALTSSLDENKILLESSPNYKNQIAESARNEAERDAWLSGDWDIVAGGMFDGIWQSCRHYIMIDPFDVPDTWRITRSFDWGSSHPFSVGWYAESDGSDVTLPDRRVRHTLKGDVFRIREWYGSTGRDNKGIELVPEEISKGIIEREIGWGIYGKVRGGIADSAIFDRSLGSSIADRMREPVIIEGKTYIGIEQVPCEKGPGSRINGWQNMRNWMSNTKPAKKGLPREKPGFFVFKGNNDHFERTVPTLPRDGKNLDDVDTNAEDHIADEVRYRLAYKKAIVTQRGF